MKKKLVLLCKDLYFSLPCIKYSGACGYSYYMNVLGIYIDPRGEKPIKPKWLRPWIWNLSVKLSDVMINFMVKNKKILKEDYYRKKVQFQ